MTHKYKIKNNMFGKISCWSDW